MRLLSEHRMRQMEATKRRLREDPRQWDLETFVIGSRIQLLIEHINAHQRFTEVARRIQAGNRAYERYQ